MTQSKYKTDPKLLDLVQRMKSREITRQQAADAYGKSLDVLNVILSRTELNKELVDVRNYTGDHLFKPDPTKTEPYAEAIALALQINSVKGAHRKFPHLSYQMLARRVSAARGEDGRTTRWAKAKKATTT